MKPFQFDLITLNMNKTWISGKNIINALRLLIYIWAKLRQNWFLKNSIRYSNILLKEILFMSNVKKYTNLDIIYIQFYRK